MSSDTTTQSDSGFFDRKTTKDFGKAVGTLTLVFNGIMQATNAIIGTAIPNAILAVIILVLAGGYVFTFIRRTKGESIPQYAIASFVNILLLFSTISGANKALDYAKPEKSSTEEAKQTADMSDIFYYLIFPKQSVFSEKQEALEILQDVQDNITSTNELVSNIVATNSESISNSASVVDSMKAYINNIKEGYNKVRDITEAVISNTTYSSAPAPAPRPGREPSTSVADGETEVAQLSTQEPIQEMEHSIVQADSTMSDVKPDGQIRLQEQLVEQKKQLSEQQAKLEKVRAKWSQK